jgi:hypothetical protein
MEAENLDERIKRIAAERERLAQEETAMRVEAQQELDRILDEIEKLEERREVLETFLNVNDQRQRLERGTIRDLCFGILRRYPDGLTSGQIKEIIGRENKGIRLGSVAAGLSYQTAQGRLERDERGRYFLVEELE